MPEEDLAGSARWAVAVEGERFDLQDAQELFTNGAVQVRVVEVPSNPQQPIMLSREFEGLNNSVEVNDASTRIFDMVNGIMFVLDPARKPVRGGTVYERVGNGWDRGHIIGRMEAIESRSRFSAHGVVSRAPGPLPPPPPPPPPQITWMTLAARDDTVADVLTFLRGGKVDWFDLYKAFELMRDDINRALGQHNYPQMGWPERASVNEFSESAQVYRHSRVRWGRYDLNTAMKAEAARKFVQGLARIWLDWRSRHDT